MFTKAVFYNLALQALLLNRQVINPNVEKSNEVKVLNSIWDVAFMSALADMDLDSTSTQSQLQLMHNFTLDAPPVNNQPRFPWDYAYGYPSNCAFFRRIVSCQVMDDKQTHHPKRVMIWQSKKVIMTSEPYAIGEFIQKDFPMATLSAPAGQTIALRLAYHAAPLIVGKGARTLRDQIKRDYIISKAEAQALDERESFSFQTDANMSEFVKVRLE